MASVAVALLLAIGPLLTVAPPVRAASFSDTAGNPFEADIEWLVGQGITRGCGGGLYCPKEPVTREQMASFLVRMFGYPATATDYFSDDGASPHHADINALAATGVTNGCGGSAFCPSAVVTREQMASFLSRAGALPVASADYFLDDGRSGHQADINRLAAAGVTNGCGGIYEYCPTGVVTREQMAAFLHRLGTGGGVVAVPPPGGAPPTCTYTDVLTARRSYGDWATTLLDTIYMLPADYHPGDLVDTGAAGLNAGYAVRSHVVADLAAMAAAARAVGAPLRLVSGFRSYATQQATFDYWVSVGGYEAALATSARAGHSEHQLGTTVDVTSLVGPAPWDYADWGATAAGAWMRDNAWRYGFVMSYPAGRQAVTCYAYEPWHFRYIGRELAAKVHASGLTLREWIWRVHAS
jgi:D-alanyl-D-alanine carboxypeptidase